MKKLLFVAVILLHFSCDQQKTDQKNLYDFVPQNTFAVVQVNDFNIIENALNNQALLSKLEGIQPAISSRIKAITPEKISSPALYCFSSIGKSDIAISLIYRKNENDSLIKKPTHTVTYNGFTIEKKRIGSAFLFQSQFQDIHYVTDTQLILENSIRNHQKETQGQQDPTFFKLAENNDADAPMNLMFHKLGGEFIQSIFPETPLFPKMGKSWTAYDFNTKKDPFTMDGVTFINDSLPDELSLIHAQESKSFNLLDLVPQSFQSFLALSVSNMEVLENNFKNYSRQQNIPLNTIDFSLFNSVDEIGWMTQETSKAVFFHLNNNNPLSKELIQRVNEKKYRDVSYYSGVLPKEMRLFLEAFGTSVNPQWMMLINDFLVYGEDEKIMQLIISSFKDKNNLATDTNYSMLKESLADNATFLWMGHSSNLKEHWQGLNKNFSDEQWDLIIADQYPLIALQAVAENNVVQFRFTLQQKNPNQTSNTPLNQYNFTLDAALISSPQWLKNHRSKTMDIAVQDANNTLYLFSNTGTLFWKKKLSGKIIGPIKQVDLYKNGRVQMAFRTANRFMILDRNGKTVPPFDIKVSDELPIQPLAVFDYDHSRDYRFLLANGKSLSMYNRRGKRVSGFKLNKLQYPLTRPPKHFRLASKDFILMQQSDGNIRIISRTGKDRIRLNEKINFSDNAVFSYLNKFSTTDTYGNLVQIDTKGNITRTPKTLDENHYIDMTSKTLVTLSDNVLTIKGIPINLPFGNYTRPKIFYINNTILVSTTDTDAKKVFLFYSNGTAVNGFPVYGQGPIDITNADDDAALEMVVQSEENGLIVYQILL